MATSDKAEKAEKAPKAEKEDKTPKAEKTETAEKPEKAAVRRLRERGDVEKALEQSAPGEQQRRPDSRRPKVWLIATTILAALLGAERVMREIVEEELGSEMMKHVRVYRDLLAQTPVDRLTVQEKPVVVFRVSDNTWIEAIVRYLVDPKRAGRVKTALTKKLLARLNAAPDKVLFPKADNR